jgi:uncharacterized protein (DUF2062 family)
MALAFDVRRQLIKSDFKTIQSRVMHGMVVGSVVSSFAFILALVIGFI